MDKANERKQIGAMERYGHCVHHHKSTVQLKSVLNTAAMERNTYRITSVTISPW